jgi:hypothetical protein
VVTSTGFLSLNQRKGVTSEGPGVKQGFPTCTNAGVKGNFGLEARGVHDTGAPVTRPVAFIGELKLSGDGVISGHMAGSEDGTIFNLKEEPVTGTYSVNSDCRGWATITPKGRHEMAEQRAALAQSYS